MSETTGRLTPQFSSAPNPATTSAALLCAGGFALLGLFAYAPQWISFLQALLGDGLSPVITNRDFANYWLGGQLFMQGEHRILFTQDSYFAYLTAQFGADAEIRAWSYPPHYLLFLWPLGLLDYKTALVVYLGVTFALFLLAVRVFRRHLAPDAHPGLLFLAIAGYFMLMIVATQNGFLVAAFLLFGLAWSRQRPMLAGLAFACLTVKPQLGLLMPLLLLFDRNWKVIGWSALFTGMLVLLSIALCGIESWTAYASETLAYQRFVMTNWDGIFLAMMPTAFGSLRALGISPALALNFQLVVSVAALALIVWLLVREPDPLRRCFVVACGTFLVTPYAFNYDMGALCVIAAVLAGSNRAPAEHSGVLMIAAVAGMAAAVMHFGRAGLPISSFLLAAGLLVIAADVHRSARVIALETQPSVP